MSDQEETQDVAAQPRFHDGFEQALSLERFGRYLIWAGGDRRRAIELYTINTALSESLYTPLQMLEVALRNRIHAVMSQAFHEDWLRDESRLTGEYQIEQLQKAIDEVAAANKELSSGRIVAALTFSFWTAMFGKNYEDLWQRTLHKIAKREDGKGLRRKDFSGPLTKIRLLRNRIAHHEPIVMWNLPARHRQIMTLTGWLSPVAADWCRTHCRFAGVYPTERIYLHEPDLKPTARTTDA